MIVDHAIKIFDNAFVLNMEVITSLQGFYTFVTFDDCLKGQRLFGTDLIQWACYLDGNFSNNCLELKNVKGLTNITTYFVKQLINLLFSRNSHENSNKSN